MGKWQGGLFAFLFFGRNGFKTFAGNGIPCASAFMPESAGRRPPGQRQSAASGGPRPPGLQGVFAFEGRLTRLHNVCGSGASGRFRAAPGPRVRTLSIDMVTPATRSKPACRTSFARAPGRLCFARSRRPCGSFNPEPRVFYKRILLKSQSTQRGWAPRMLFALSSAGKFFRTSYNFQHLRRKWGRWAYRSSALPLRP